MTRSDVWLNGKQMVEGVDSLCLGDGTEQLGHLGEVLLFSLHREGQVSLVGLGLSGEAGFKVLQGLGALDPRHLVRY